MAGRIAQHWLIHGEVQGVGFRLSMVREAERLGASGWVRNRREGTVEAAVEGSPEAVQALRQWADHGPRGATVTRVEVADDPGGHTGFRTRETV